MNDVVKAAKIRQLKARQAALRAKQEKPFGQKLKENLLGDNDPATQNFGEKLGTALNMAGEAMTFGLIGDEASAAVESALPGVSYEDRRDHYRGEQAALEGSNPKTALAAQVGGALLPIALMGGAAAPQGLMAMAGRGAATGGVMGGALGFMEGEGDGRVDGALMGAALGAGAGGIAAPLATKAVGSVAEAIKGRTATRQAAANAPTTEQLRAAGNAAYRQVDEAGLQITPEAFARIRAGMTEAADDVGLDRLPGPSSLTPKSARVVQKAGEMSDEMAAEETAALPFKSLDQLRRHAGTAAGDLANKTDSAAGARMIASLDDAVQALGPDDVTAGELEAVQTLIPKAREIWSKMSKSQTIDDAIEAGGDYLSGGSSGIKNQFKNILRSPKRSRGFSEAEKKMMRRVVNGSAPERLLHLMAGGLGNIGMMGGGAAMGGPIGFAAGAGAAAGARKLSEAITRKNAEKVRAVVANGGMRELPVIAPESAKRIRAATTRGGTAAGQSGSF